MKKKIAEILLDLNAVALRLEPPFTWASGRKSPVYCDNRLIISDPQKRDAVARSFVKMIEESGWNPDVIAGTATAGIPHAAFVAQIMNLPMIYVRNRNKAHGKGNRIEGRLDKGQKVVLIEDLISTGNSSIEAGNGVKEAGGKLSAVAAIFTYGLPVAAQRFADADMQFKTLTDFTSLMQVAGSRGSLSDEQAAIIEEWQKNPAAWSKERGGEG